MANQPVLFIHGLWLHASSWQPWIELFTAEGYAPVAPLWPGERDTVAATRDNPDDVADKGIDEVTKHFATIIEAMEVPPVIIGHSFGGLITEKLIGEGYGNAGVAIDPAQIKGVLPLPFRQLRASFPVLSNPANIHKPISLTRDQFAYGFANQLPEAEATELYERWTIPSTVRPIFQAAAANFRMHSETAVDTKNEDRGPLLLIAGGEDNTAPEVTTDATLKQYRDSNAVTELITFRDRGHSLVIDHGWREVATEVLVWLEQQGLRD
ncbi:alpha/beta hydrolase [Leifsonia sp. NPDC080035]|uniref:Alpha/beta hydrolase n=1 Tax=Leifsonia sp. NPDC080035 TaxID=3143936 RepID=A0AAU7GCD2_9MICO